jgi:hypothetical protein
MQNSHWQYLHDNHIPQTIERKFYTTIFPIFAQNKKIVTATRDEVIADNYALCGI